MSYCVNCGVELADSERACPLCGVVANNPKTPSKKTPPRTYPPKRETPQTVDRRELALPFALLMMIPVLISAFADFFTSGNLTWSAYVTASTGLLYVFVLPPVLQRRRRTVLCLSLDCAAMILFLYLLERLTGGSWFLTFCLPVTVIAWALIVGIIILFARVDMRKFMKTAIVLFAVGSYSVCIELLLHHFIENVPRVSWSMFVLIPCVILGVVALLLNKNQPVKDALRRRFFI